MKTLESARIRTDLPHLGDRWPERPVSAGTATVFGLDAAGTVLSVNANFEQTAGFSRYEILGRNLNDIRDGPDPALFRYLRTAVDDPPRATTADGLRKDPRDACANISVIPLVGPLGQVCQIVTIRRHDEALSGLGAMTDGKSTFLVRIGWIAASFGRHAYRLLTPILWHAERILARLPEGDPLRASAAEILRAGNRLSFMIRRFLAFGRGLRLKPLPFDLNALVEGRRFYPSRTNGPAIRLETHLAAGLAPVYADAAQVGWVLEELVANACEAMPRGGSLRIETADVYLDRRTFRHGAPVAAGGYAAITVRDTGKGMDEQTRAVAFDPFFTTKPGAMGLGLSSVYGFVKQSGGYIWVQGGPGQGTEVTVYLPFVHGSGPVAARGCTHGTSARIGPDLIGGEYPC